VPWALSPKGAAFATSAQALHLACHASCGFGSLSLQRLCELVLVVRSDARGGGFDWDTFIGLARQSGVLSAAYPALHMVELLAPGTVPRSVRHAARSQAPAAVLTVLRRLSPATAQRIHRCSLEERFMWMPSRWRVALAVMRDLLLPSTSFTTMLTIQRNRLFRLLRGTVTWSGSSSC